MAERLPWFPFYYMDFFRDEKVKLMSLAQVGMYLHLLAHEWHEGSLPNQYGALARIAHLPQVSEVQGRDERELTFVVKSCFVKNGTSGRIINPRLESIRAEQLAEIQKNKDRTAKARQSLSDKRSTRSVTDTVTGIVTATESESESESDIKTSSSVLQKEPSRKASAKRRSVLPEDFQPNSRHEEIAKGLGLNLAVEFTKFKDHHQSKGSLMLDWDAALRKWLRNAVEFRRPR